MSSAKFLRGPEVFSIFFNSESLMHSDRDWVSQSYTATSLNQW